jgi:hypothetical protein
MVDSCDLELSAEILSKPSPDRALDQHNISDGQHVDFEGNESSPHPLNLRRCVLSIPNFQKKRPSLVRTCSCLNYERRRIPDLIHFTLCKPSSNVALDNEDIRYVL